MNNTGYIPRFGYGRVGGGGGSGGVPFAPPRFPMKPPNRIRPPWQPNLLPQPPQQPPPGQIMLPSDPVTKKKFPFPSPYNSNGEPIYGLMGAGSNNSSANLPEMSYSPMNFGQRRMF